MKTYVGGKIPPPLTPTVISSVRRCVRDSRLWWGPPSHDTVLPVLLVGIQEYLDFEPVSLPHVEVFIQVSSDFNTPFRGFFLLYPTTYLGTYPCPTLIVETVEIE